jgi:hypothetical protein
MNQSRHTRKSILSLVTYTLGKVGAIVIGLETIALGRGAALWLPEKIVTFLLLVVYAISDIVKELLKTFTSPTGSYVLWIQKMALSTVTDRIDC